MTAQKVRNIKDTDIEVGRRIRLMRLKCGLTQQELADLLGISFQQVHKYEKGVNRVGASRIHHLSQIFAAPPSAFFSNNVIKRTETSDLVLLKMFLLSKEGEELNIAFAQIASLKLRKQIVSLVTILANQGD